jgi:hypothetical protein
MLSIWGRTKRTYLPTKTRRRAQLVPQKDAKTNLRIYLEKSKMKKPNTLPELLRHAADLTERGESLVGQFEYRLTSDGVNSAWSILRTEYPIFRVDEPPKTFILDGVELNRPYESAPANGAQYGTINNAGEIAMFAFNGGHWDKRALANHNCWKTEEDAKAYQAVIKNMMAKALGEGSRYDYVH